MEKNNFENMNFDQKKEDMIRQLNVMVNNLQKQINEIDKCDTDFELLMVLQRGYAEYGKKIY